MSSNKQLRTHDQSRLIVCACCGLKNLKCAKINDNLEKIIQDHVYKGYSKENSSFPLGVCPSCRPSLFIAKKQGQEAVSKKVRDTWNLDLEEFRPPSRKSPCNCRVCSKVRIRDVKLDDESTDGLPRLVDAEDEVSAENNGADEDSTKVLAF